LAAAKSVYLTSVVTRLQKAAEELSGSTEKKKKKKKKPTRESQEECKAVK